MLTALLVVASQLYGVVATRDSTALLPLWPLPLSVEVIDANPITLDYSFRFIAGGDYGSVITGAIARYEELISLPAGSKGKLKECSILVANSTAGMSSIVGSDEAYELTLSTEGGCKIASETNWGALRGMETFTHLLSRSTIVSGRAEEQEQVQAMVGGVTISDSPRFGHRGMLIDTSRHYLTVDTIKKVIDTLPANKLNVLHWHAVDAQSFPLDTPSEPSLVRGAYSSSMTYSMDDVAAVTAFAYERGVEVVMEVDVPGHAASWTKGRPEIMAKCFQKYSYNINDFALNPTLDETYSVLEGVLKDLVASSASSAGTGSSSNRLHLGGDEVVYGCWAEDDSIVAFMDEQGMTSYDELLAYFVGKADAIGANLGKKVIHWEEVFTAGCSNVDKENIFQVWTDSSIVSQITAAEYQVIASPSNYWYLNIPENTWQVMYSYDPTANLTTPSQQDLVVGGEVALWGEYIDDLNILSNLYPRASAAAERLWSGQEVTQDAEAAQALDRLLVQRCRMVNRDVSASPVQPAGYCDSVPV